MRPFNEVLPEWRHNPKATGRAPRGQVLQNATRPNLYKHSTDVLGCWQLRTHSADFIPPRLIPRMASGDRFSVLYVVLYMEQVPDYYVANSFAIIFGISLLGMSMGVVRGSSEWTIEVLVVLMLVRLLRRSAPHLPCPSPSILPWPISTPPLPC